MQIDPQPTPRPNHDHTPAPASPPSDEEINREIEKFLYTWETDFKEETADCLPDSILVSLAKEMERGGRAPDWEKLAQPYARKQNQPKWPEHLKNCDHCKQIVLLLQNKNRVRISIEQIFERSSRQAQEAMSYRRPGGWERIRAFVGANPLVPVLATATVLLLAVTVGRQANFFKQPEQVATASFREDKPRVIIEGLNAKLEEVKSSAPHEYEKKQLLEDLKRREDETNALITQKLLNRKEYGQIVNLLVAYKNEIDKLGGKPSSPRPKTLELNGAESNRDMATVTALLLNVGMEIARQEGVAENNPTALVDKGLKNIKVEAIEDDVLVVQEVSADPQPEKREAVLQGAQNFATQKNRTLEVRIGDQVRRVSPTSAFVP